MRTTFSHWSSFFAVKKKNLLVGEHRRHTPRSDGRSGAADALGHGGSATTRRGVRRATRKHYHFRENTVASARARCEPRAFRALVEERSAFGWLPEDIPDPCAKETFEANKLRWSDVDTPAHAECLAFTRALIALRSRHLCLAAHTLTDVRCELSPHQRGLRVVRGEAHVFANLGEVSSCPIPRGHTLWLASSPLVRCTASAITLPADTFAVTGPTRGGC